MRVSLKAFFLVLALFVGLCFAQVPREMNYKGKLSDGDGVALNGDHEIVFKIYNSSTGGTALWSEERTGAEAIEITNGLFDVQLGEIEEIDLPFNEPYWLELTVDGELLEPREKLAPVAYAYRAIKADSVDNIKVNTDETLLGDGSIGSPLHAVGDGWGSDAVHHDGTTMAGDGTASSPLSAVVTSSGGNVDPGLMTMFWEAYLKCAGCEDLIPDWGNPPIIPEAQNLWTRAIGTVENDSGYCIVKTPDGGFVIGGISYYRTSYWYSSWVVKFGSNETIQWATDISISGGMYLRSIVPTPDGGFVVAGNYYGPSSYGALIKLNAMGGRVWAKYSTSVRIYSAVLSSDGNVVVAGQSTYGYIAKFDQSGNVLWQKDAYLMSSSGEQVYSMIETSDNGLVVAGRYSSSTLGLKKLNSTATSQDWGVSVTGWSENSSQCSVIETADNGFAVLTTTTTYGAGLTDFYFLKFSSTGELQWARAIGGAQHDYGTTVIQTPDGGYALAGYTLSFGAGNSDIMVVKLSSVGDLVWAKTFGGTSTELTHWGPCITRYGTTDSLMVVGFSNSAGFAATGYGYDYLYMKIGPNGESCSGSYAPVSTMTPTPTATSRTLGSIHNRTYSWYSMSPTITTPASSATRVCGP